MLITMTLNGKKVADDVAADTLLIDFVRNHGCLSVKRGCETANCGLCTVFMDEKPVLSCSVLAARASGHTITTLEGLQGEAAEFGAFIADQGAEQCGFCNPGFMMNAIALFREKQDPTDEEIKEYLAGNLCRCSGYEGQLRGIRAYPRLEKAERGGRTVKVVNQPLRKKDAMQLVTGQPVYVDDVTPQRLPVRQAAALAARKCHRQEHQQDRRDESPRHGGHLHMGGRRPERPPLHAGRSDLSGGRARMTALLSTAMYAL